MDLKIVWQRLILRVDRKSPKNSTLSLKSSSQFFQPEWIPLIYVLFSSQGQKVTKMHFIGQLTRGHRSHANRTEVTQILEQLKY